MTGRLWNALKNRQDMLGLARNALLLAMIVRVHFGLGALPEGRLDLYSKCVDTLLEHWTKAKDLAESPIERSVKHGFLARLAFDMQKDAGTGMGESVELRIGRPDLSRRLREFLRTNCPKAIGQVDEIIDRLHQRDAILVADGSGGFGFVHRSFQEYFAACYMAAELSYPEFDALVAEDRQGWNETLYLAVARTGHRPRRQEIVIGLLKRSKVEFAWEAIRAARGVDPWLESLAGFLLGFYNSSQRPDARACADCCGDHPRTLDILAGLFDRETREGPALAGAVALADLLAERGDSGAAALLEAFSREADGLEVGMVPVAGGRFPYGEKNKSVDVPAFEIDRTPVTNEQFSRMVPGHLRLLPKEFAGPRQPVVVVNLYEAELFARWRGCRLPTEEEWEKAASWDAELGRKRKYPWGDEFDSAKCNTKEAKIGRTTDVGSYPLGRSAVGCDDMAGNVWEWTQPGSVRGGSWFSSSDLAACGRRGDCEPYFRNLPIGFRCART